MRSSFNASGKFNKFVFSTGKVMSAKKLSLMLIPVRRIRHTRLNHNNDPLILKKRAMSKAMLEKCGFPEEFVSRQASER